MICMDWLTEITGCPVCLATRSAVRCRVPDSLVSIEGSGTSCVAAHRIRVASRSKMMAPSILASSRRRVAENSMSSGKPPVPGSPRCGRGRARSAPRYGRAGSARGRPAARCRARRRPGWRGRSSSDCSGAMLTSSRTARDPAGYVGSDGSGRRQGRSGMVPHGGLQRRRQVGHPPRPACRPAPARCPASRGTMAVREAQAGGLGQPARAHRSPARTSPARPTSPIATGPAAAAGHGRRSRRPGRAPGRRQVR